MDITINLPQPVEARLAEAAHREGVSVSEIAYRAIAEKYPTAQDGTAEALRLLERWMADVPTDPEAIREAEEDLREFQHAINQTRRELGASLVYPNVE